MEILIVLESNKHIQIIQATGLVLYVLKKGYTLNPKNNTP